MDGAWQGSFPEVDGAAACGARVRPLGDVRFGKDAAQLPPQQRGHRSSGASRTAIAAQADTATTGKGHDHIIQFRLEVADRAGMHGWLLRSRGGCATR